MNEAKLSQSISELHEAVKSGNMEMMYHSANSLNAMFEEEVPEPLGGYEAALMRLSFCR